MRCTTAVAVLSAAFAFVGCAKKQPGTQAIYIDKENPQLARAQTGPEEQQSIGHLRAAATFIGPMPTGVAISKSNRMFVNFPRWGDVVEYTVAEVINGKNMPFPNLIVNKLDRSRAGENFVSVQSVVVDEQDRLWVLDTGSLNFGPVMPGGAKLVAYDLKTNQEVKRIAFPSDVATEASYLNDVRFDLKRGKEGTAFITDSSMSGQNGIIVVDIATGQSWRRLDKHLSTLPEQGFEARVEGKTLPLTIGSDGIALTPDGKTLYYCALAGHHLYSVSADALADRNQTDEQVAPMVKDLGNRGFASDGLACDHRGRLYLTDYENNAIRRRTEDGNYEIVAQDTRMLWPDSMAFAPDGALYFTANQLHRQARFHNGTDLRQQPYVVFRVYPDGAAAPSAQVAGWKLQAE